MAEAKFKGRLFERTRRSELYERAVSDLKKLLVEQDLDAVERAFAEAVYETRWEETSEKVGGNYRSSSVCPERLAGHKCNGNRGSAKDWNFDYGSCERIPGQDHSAGFCRDRKVVAIVTEPYEMKFETLIELIDFCKERGFRADIDAASSHFPSRTVRVIVRRNEEMYADKA